jgi:hypothetical protein
VQRLSRIFFSCSGKSSGISCTLSVSHCTLQIKDLSNYFLLHGLYSPRGPWFQFMIIFTDGRTPWMSDQLVARPLPKHRTTQTQNKHIHKPNIHALSTTGTHDPRARMCEDSLCLRPLGYCELHNYLLLPRVIMYVICGMK